MILKIFKNLCLCYNFLPWAYCRGWGSENNKRLKVKYILHFICSWLSESFQYDVGVGKDCSYQQWVKSHGTQLLCYGSSISLLRPNCWMYLWSWRRLSRRSSHEILYILKVSIPDQEFLINSFFIIKVLECASNDYFSPNPERQGSSLLFCTQDTFETKNGCYY